MAAGHGVRHRARCRLRLIGATVVVTLAIGLPLDLLVLLAPGRVPFGDWAVLKAVLAVLIACVAVVCVTALVWLSRVSWTPWRSLPVSMTLGVVAGGPVGWLISRVLEGPAEGEEANGLFFRVVGAAIVGCSVGIVAWALLRFQHGRVSGAGCVAATSSAVGRP